MNRLVKWTLTGLALVAARNAMKATKRGAKTAMNAGRILADKKARKRLLKRASD